MRPKEEDEFRQYVASHLAALRRFAYLCCGDWHRGEVAIVVVEGAATAEELVFDADTLGEIAADLPDMAAGD